MQRVLFIIVSAVAVILVGIFFLILRPKPLTTSSADAASGARFTFGPRAARVTVVDFSNYLCPHCRDHSNKVLPLIKQNYIDTGKIRYVFRDFPFAGQDNVIRAGEAAACAADNNLYIAYHDALFRAQAEFASRSSNELDGFLADLAGQVGMAPASFSECLKSGTKRAGVLADLEKARQLGLTATPSFIVNGKTFSGFMPYGRWKEILDKALAGAPEKGNNKKRVYPTIEPTPLGPTKVKRPGGNGLLPRL